jgi:hypothetical protein
MVYEYSMTIGPKGKPNIENLGIENHLLQEGDISNNHQFLQKENL